MKRMVIACAAAAALLAGAPGALAQGPKTTADWVKQLGADGLKDRDAASAALLSLGYKARDPVRDALDSTDPEVQSRAKELWKTMRWLVIPDAQDDIKTLVAQAQKGSIDAAHWQDFIQKHGAESIRLVAEFRASVASGDMQQPDAQVPQLNDIPVMSAAFRAHNPGDIYKPGLIAVLDSVPPMDVAGFVAQTDRSNGRDALDALLDEPLPDVPEKTAVNWMQIQIALWNYEKAFDFGRDYSFHTTSYEMVKECAIAADRGELSAKIHETATREIAAETDAGRLCAELSFYTGLFSGLGKKPLIDPLFDLVRKDATAGADDASLRRLVETLLSAGMADRAVKVLHNVQTPAALYMRSAADLQMQNEPVAVADWVDAMNALDAVDDAKKKESYYEVGEIMHEWRDERGVIVWQKLLSLSPANTVFDANASFRMGEIMEEHHEYAHAAEYYEKGLAIASKVPNGVMIASSPDGSYVGSGQQTVLQKIQQLKSEAAEQKSIFNNPPAAGGGNDGP
jgi:hypothetical protein